MGEVQSGGQAKPLGYDEARTRATADASIASVAPQCWMRGYID